MACIVISPFIKQCFVTLAVTINVISQGVVFGFPGILLPQLHQKDSPIVLSKTAESWLASTLRITIPIGSFMIPTIMGPFGRKTAYYVICILTSIGWVTIFFAGSVEALLVGDIIQGLSVGMMMSLYCIMIGEYSSPKYRGAFLTIPLLCEILGIFTVHFIGSFLTWKQTALICFFFPLMGLIMTLFIPESPSWLAAKGRYEECEKEFRWLRGDDENAELEAMIQARMDFDKTKAREKKLNILLIIKKKEFYKPIALTVHIYLLALLSGPIIFVIYSMEVISRVMNPGVNARAWMIGLDAQRIFTNALAIYVIHKVSRRTMIFVCSGICLVSHIAIVIYIYFRNLEILTYQGNWLPGMFITLQIVSASIGIQPLISITAGEVFPLEFRSIADCIMMVIRNLFTFIIFKTFVGLVDSIGIGGTYTFYASLMVYCLVVIWFLMPETKGKTLLQIEEEFTGKTSRVENVEQRVPLKNERK